MYIDFSQRGKLSKYKYLYQEIRKQIISGELKSGEKMPSKRALAQQLNVGVITVAEAYDLLQAEGYIIASERKGFFVQSISHLQRPQADSTKDRAALSADSAEQSYFVDTRANRISLSLFPKNKWNQLMRKTIMQSDNTLFSTVPFNGIYELRKAIADYLESSVSIHCSPSQIIIGAGTEYLYNRILQLLKRTCVFGFEDPGKTNLPQLCTQADYSFRYIPIDYDGLIVEKLDQSDVDAIHISPANHFPTGIRLSPSRRNELVNWAYRASKRYIIEDDYDSEFLYRGSHIPPLFATLQHGKVIYMNTFSKTMVPSLRISYMILPEELMEIYRETMSFYSCTVSSFEQYTLAQFISQGYLNQHINRLKRRYNAIREYLVNKIRESPLGHVSTIYQFGSGTHLLLTVHTKLTDDMIYAAGLQRNLQLQLYSKLCHSEFTKRSGVLVINYASIDPHQIDAFIALLCEIFPECRLSHTILNRLL